MSASRNDALTGVARGPLSPLDPDRQLRAWHVLVGIVLGILLGFAAGLLRPRRLQLR